jgi:hypothetical protein
MKIAIDPRVRRLLTGDDRALFEATIAVLSDELPEILGEFCERVIPPDCYICRIVGDHDDDSAMNWIFELLLRELQHVARAPGWPDRVRLMRVREALDRWISQDFPRPQEM